MLQRSRAKDVKGAIDEFLNCGDTTGLGHGNESRLTGWFDEFGDDVWLPSGDFPCCFDGSFSFAFSDEVERDPSDYS